LRDAAPSNGEEGKLTTEVAGRSSLDTVRKRIIYGSVQTFIHEYLKDDAFRGTMVHYFFLKTDPS
jgi:hypothetical protein